ncbi:MAG: flagellar biosynthetic protein FliO [Gammaproteobacteria bacterium]|nr:flagellar biosynthetic protein FliO [Gammaproteobacteria bacterium]
MSFRPLQSCSLFLIWALSAAAFAVEERGLAQTGGTLAAGALTETAMGLIAIIALIFALSWFFRRFGRQALSGKGMVSVVGGVSLGPRERAVLLQVGATRLLVGVAPGQVRTLHVLDAEEAADTATDGIAFDQRLRQQLEEGLS